MGTRYCGRCGSSYALLCDAFVMDSFVDLQFTLCSMHTQVKFPTLTLDAAIDRLQTGKGLKPQEQRVLTLDMEFTPSLALYVWQSFRKAPYARHKHVANIWAIAAQVCSTQGCIATSTASSSRFLPDILNVDPLQTFSAETLLYQNPSESPQPFVMPQVEPWTQNLLLFAQLLTAIAAERNSLLATMTAPPSSTSEDAHLRPAIASMLQTLTDVNCYTPVPLTDSADAPEPLSEPSQLVVMLRRAVLILKLATLTYNVKADLLGHDEGTPISVLSISMQTLWYSMAAVTRSLLTISVAELGAVDVCTPSANARGVLSLRPADKEVQTLCTVLIEHLLLTLRQCLKGPHAKVLSVSKVQKVACLVSWEVLLPIMHPDQLGPQTKRLGKASLLGASSACLHVVLPFTHACLLCLIYSVWRCIGRQSSYVEHQQPPQLQGLNCKAACKQYLWSILVTHVYRNFFSCRCFAGGTGFSGS